MSDQQQMRSVITVLMVVALTVSGSLAFLLFNETDSERSSEQRGGDFVLNSSQGPVSLQQFRGQAVLLFFGYTHCPDVCPTTMSNVADALNLLSEKEQMRVQSLFITVDPIRDTVEHLEKYVGFFHSKIIGLSGSSEQIKRAAEAFSVQYFRDDVSDAGIDNYYMNHTSYLFLIGMDGKVVDMMSDHTTPEDIAKALRRLIAE